MAAGGPLRRCGASGLVGGAPRSEPSREKAWLWAAASARNLARRLRRERARRADAPALVARAEFLRRSLQTHAALDAWNKHHRHNMGAALAEAKLNGLPPHLEEQARRDKRAGDWARHAPFSGSGATGSAEVECTTQYVVVPVDRVKVVPHFIVVQVSPPVAPEGLEQLVEAGELDVDTETTEKHLELVAEAAKEKHRDQQAREAAAGAASSRPPLALAASSQVERGVIDVDPDSDAESRLLQAFQEPASIVEEHEPVVAVTEACACDGPPAGVGGEEAPASEERAVAAAIDPRSVLSRQNLEVVAGQVFESVGPIGTDQEFEDVVTTILLEFEPLVQSVKELEELQDWTCEIVNALIDSSNSAQ